MTMYCTKYFNLLITFFIELINLNALFIYDLCVGVIFLFTCFFFIELINLNALFIYDLYIKLNILLTQFVLF